MKLVVDEKNRCVIAMGSYKGKKVKAVVRCHPEDTFDAELGKKIATQKYNFREVEKQIEIHESNLRALKRFTDWALRCIADEESHLEHLYKKKASRFEKYSELVKY
jgi:succinyl-CoA synthetase beta subunit